MVEENAPEPQAPANIDQVRLELLVSAMNQGRMWQGVYDLDTRVNQMADGFWRHLGYPIPAPDDSDALLRSIVYPEDLAASDELMNTVMARGEAVDWIWRIRSLKGAWRTFRVFIRPELKADRSLRRIVGVLHDVHDELMRQTELTQQRMAAETARRELDELINSQETGLAMLTLSRMVMRCNAAYAALFGLSPQQLQGQFLGPLEPRHIAASREALVERVRRGEIVREQVIFPHVDGRWRTLRLVYTPRRDARGVVVGYIASVMDITEFVPPHLPDIGRVGEASS